MESSLKDMLDWLKSVAQEVRSLEAEAALLLHDQNDSQAYRRKMVEKATLLAGLTDQAGKHLAALDPAQAKPVRERLERFSKSAGTALDLGSVFFMSALLYPEDFQPGDKNDLETFIDALQKG